MKITAFALLALIGAAVELNDMHEGAEPAVADAAAMDDGMGMEMEHADDSGCCGGSNISINVDFKVNGAGAGAAAGDAAADEAAMEAIPEPEPEPVCQNLDTYEFIPDETAPFKWDLQCECCRDGNLVCPEDTSIFFPTTNCKEGTENCDCTLLPPVACAAGVTTCPAV